MAAGPPMLQQISTDGTTAVDELVRATGAGLRYVDADDVAGQLGHPGLLAGARDAVAAVRDRFTFDAHVDDLITLFERVTR